MNTATLSVPEIHCDHCKMSIEGAVSELDGVSSAEVAVDTATVAVTFADPVTVPDIIAAIESQGYEVPEQN